MNSRRQPLKRVRISDYLGLVPDAQMFISPGGKRFRETDGVVRRQVSTPRQVLRMHQTHRDAAAECRIGVQCRISDRNDATRIHELLARHYKYTQSGKAKTILDNWAHYLPLFVKVMPVEYARALADLEKAQETSNGLTVGVKRA